MEGETPRGVEGVCEMVGRDSWMVVRAAAAGGFAASQLCAGSSIRIVVSLGQKDDELIFGASVWGGVTSLTCSPSSTLAWRSANALLSGFVREIA